MRKFVLLGLVLAAACRDLEPREIGGRVDLAGITEGVVIAATDFQRGAGIVQFLALEPSAERFRLFTDLELISPDPVARAFPAVTPDDVWVVNRLGFDNVQVLAADNNFVTRSQFSVGNGANPQDVLVVSPDKAYVSRYEDPYNDLLIVHPTRGTPGGKIPLEQFATNPDRLPRPAALLQVGGRVFVALQNLDATFNWGADSAENGRIAVVDAATDQLLDADTATAEVDPIVLHSCNPQALVYSAADNKIYVVSAGLFVQYHPELSGIETINPDTLQAESVILRGDDPGLGGNLLDLELPGGSTGYLLVATLTAGQRFQSKVAYVNLAAGTHLSDLYVAAPDAMISDLALSSSGLLLFADRGYLRPALVVWDPVAGTVVKTLPLEPPPFSLALWNPGN